MKKTVILLLSFAFLLLFDTSARAQSPLEDVQRGNLGLIQRQGRRLDRIWGRDPHRISPYNPYNDSWDDDENYYYDYYHPRHYDRRPSRWYYEEEYHRNHYHGRRGTHFSFNLNFNVRPSRELYFYNNSGLYADIYYKDKLVRRISAGEYCKIKGNPKNYTVYLNEKVNGRWKVFSTDLPIVRR